MFDQNDKKFFYKLCTKVMTSGEGILGAYSTSETFSKIPKDKKLYIMTSKGHIEQYVCNQPFELGKFGNTTYYDLKVFVNDLGYSPGEDVKEFHSLQSLRDAFNNTPGFASRIEDDQLIVICSEGIRAEGIIAEELGLTGVSEQ
ncbi:MAG: hypothetical protein K0Q51_1544 [Rickettsiaceae bacterium]|jgi:hypothetical protein|nr:hypothetical protein [Rickettsiaceae bacterium]